MHNNIHEIACVNTLQKSPIFCCPYCMLVQSGFTYLGVMFLVFLMGLVLSAVGTVWFTFQQREKERELLFIGEQFRLAIQLYYEHTPSVVKQYPPNLEELLKDSRYVTVHRYLRKIYRDPIIGESKWGIIEGPGGGIAGVYSLSNTRPLKMAGFVGINQSFEGKTTYSDWKFVYLPLMAPVSISSKK